MTRFSKNITNKRVWILTILLFSTAFYSEDAATMSAKTQDTAKVMLDPDINNLDIRVPSADKIEVFQKDKRFKYSFTKADISWKDRIRYWINDNIINPAKVILISNGNYVIIIVLIVFIIYILLKLYGLNVDKIFSKKKLEQNINIYSEDIHELDYHNLIQTALSNKNYRLAIRFMYLRNLKELSDKALIKWNTNKTNYSYRNEIKNPTLRANFSDTTLTFDYIWYGEFPLNELNFSKAYKQLDNFYKMITDET